MGSSARGARCSHAPKFNFSSNRELKKKAGQNKTRTPGGCTELRKWKMENSYAMEQNDECGKERCMWNQMHRMIQQMREQNDAFTECECKVRTVQNSMPNKC